MSSVEHVLAGGGGGIQGYWNEPLAMISELEKELKAPQRALSSIEQYISLLPQHKLSAASAQDLKTVCDLLDRVQSELVMAHTRNLLQQAKENVALYEKRLGYFDAK